MNLKSILIVSTLGVVGAAHAVTIADWTFETSQPTTAGPLTPEVGAGSALAFHAGTSTYSTPVGNGSAHSFSSNTWAVGDYYQYSASTLGLSNIGFTFDQTSSGTGPGSFQLAYSTDGTNFTSFGSAYTLNNVTFSSITNNPLATYSFNLSSVTALNNKSTVYFRVVDASTTSLNGGTVAATGTDRMDNVTIGTVQATPEPSAFAALGVGALALLRRRRRA